MGMNKVQFQKGLSMAEFMERYGTEERCHAALVNSRWPAGFVCPSCGGSRHSTFERKGLQYWQCTACREQTTATGGTIFQATKLPLTRWFLAMHLLTQAKNNVSALELKRHLEAAPWTFAFGLFFASVLLYSQAATTRALMPLGIALGIPPQFLIAMFPSVNGYFFIPTYGSLIAAINFDLSGTTRIGKYVLNHSFMIPGVIATFVAVSTGLLLARVMF